MNISTIIFDLDGTLLDSLKDLTNSVNHTMTHYGFPTRSIDEVKSFVGNGVKILLKRSFPYQRTEDQLNEALAVFRSHYELHMNDHTTIYDGLEPILNELGNTDKNLAIVSNKLDSAVQLLNQRFFYPHIPLAIGTPPDHKKPDPYSIYQIMEHYHTDSSQTIYVGDSEVDIETAHNAGIKCIGVSWGFRGHSFLQKHKADYIVDTPNDLLKLLIH